MKKKYLTKAERAEFSLSADLKAIMVGLIIGDLHVRKFTPSCNPFLRFEQSIIHKDYIFHLYDLFSNYCMAPPKIANRLPDKRTGRVYSRVTFITYSLPCFKDMYDLFYCAGKKVIPLNIADLLTPLGLAYLICDDGCWSQQGKRISPPKAGSSIFLTELF